MAEAVKFLNLPIFGRYNYLEQWMAKLRDNDELTGLKVSLEYQYAMLRYTFSTETKHVCDSFNLYEDDLEKTRNNNLKIRDICQGIINETMERHCFNIDFFFTDIKVLGKNCNFGN